MCQGLWKKFRKNKLTDEKQGDQLIDLFSKKFTKDCTIEERHFLEIIKKWRKDHKDCAKKNKENYFKKNAVLISLLSGNKIISILAGIFGTITASVGITEILKKCLEILEIVNSTTDFTVVVIIVMCIIFCGLIIFVYSLTEKRKNLQLRKYGETWVRHTVALYNYEQEILKYTYALDYYSNENEKNQRKLFMEKILSIEEKNMFKFDENMKNLDECIN